MSIETVELGYAKASEWNIAKGRRYIRLHDPVVSASSRRREFLLGELQPIPEKVAQRRVLGGATPSRNLGDEESTCFFGLPFATFEGTGQVFLAFGRRVNAGMRAKLSSIVALSEVSTHGFLGCLATAFQ